MASVGHPSGTLSCLRRLPWGRLAGRPPTQAKGKHMASFPIHHRVRTAVGADRRPRRRTRRIGVLALVALSLLASACNFYQPPSPLPAGRPGDVIKSESSVFYLDPLKTVRADATVNRVMYRSTNRAGQAVAVTGTILTPKTAWTGAGQRPIVAAPVGTQGLGDQCAPSRQLAAGTEYEGSTISGLLNRGYGVVVTDYLGLGTPGEHTYIIRVDQANAVLDSLRAAQRLPEANLPDAGPVAIIGYSQGGGASAAAAELAPAYAPELDIKGAVAGAVPADPTPLADHLDGSFYSSFLYYAVSGMQETYRLDPAAIANPQGLALLDALRHECVDESLSRHPFVRSNTLTVDGRPLSVYLTEEPYRTIAADQVIGSGRKPTVPVLVNHALLDDVIPYQVGVDLARRWCRQGANVVFETTAGAGHIGGGIAAQPGMFRFLEDRFAGRPQTSGCSTI